MIKIISIKFQLINISLNSYKVFTDIRKSLKNQLT
jgi:hypothetical protein